MELSAILYIIRLLLCYRVSTMDFNPINIYSCRIMECYGSILIDHSAVFIESLIIPLIIVLLHLDQFMSLRCKIHLCFYEIINIIFSLQRVLVLILKSKFTPYLVQSFSYVRMWITHMQNLVVRFIRKHKKVITNCS